MAIDETNTMRAPVGEGDAGIVIRKDGRFEVFTVGKLTEPLTPEQIQQGKTLMALAYALQTPEIMATLERAVEDQIADGDPGFRASVRN